MGNFLFATLPILNTVVSEILRTDKISKLNVLFKKSKSFNIKFRLIRFFGSYQKPISIGPQ